MKVDRNNKIDSLEVWVEAERCQIIDKDFLSYTRVYYENSGTLSEERRKASCMTRTDLTGSISFRTGIKEIQGKTYITNVITSKMLGAKYFEGITKENIQDVYSIIMQQGIYECSFEAFKEGMTIGVDVCWDLYLNLEEGFIKFANDIKKNTINGKIHNEESQPFNRGIQWNKRPTGSYKTPYVKIYYKGAELKGKSKVFKETYLADWETEGLVRMEVAIKNRRMRESLINNALIPKYKSLEELLEIKEYEWNKLMAWAMNKNLNPDKMIVNQNEELSPTEVGIQQLIKLVIEAEVYRLDELVEIIPRSYEAKNKNTQKKGRYRLKELLTRLSDELKKKDNEYRKKIHNDEDWMLFCEQAQIEI